MQPVSRIAPAARQPRCVPRARGLELGRCRLRLGRAGGGAARGAHGTLRVRCGGGTEPAEARKDGDVPGEEEEAGLGLAEEELEVLEEEAIGEGDEGRRPTDYNRRAHIFEESSRVFRALKHRRDGDGVKTAETTHETNGST